MHQKHMSQHNFLPPCRIRAITTLPRHAGIIPYLFLEINARIGTYSVIRFRNESKYSMTHMLNPTLIKLNVHALLQLWLNSKRIPLDGEYIRDISQNDPLFLSLLFLGSISIRIFLSSYPLKRIHFVMRWSSFFLSHKYSVHFSLVPSRRTTCKSLSKKITIKTLSSILYHRWAEIEYFFTLIPYHRWAETELMNEKLNKL